MLSAIIWGLIQGLTEFLPISSSGHLVLVPAFLSAAGVDLGEPSLAVSAVLHLGTLVAVLVYFRADVLTLLRFRKDAGSRKLWTLILIGTLPVLVGYPLSGPLERLQDHPDLVGAALVGTGLVLLLGTNRARLWIQRRESDGHALEKATSRDAFLIGLAQMLALIPGLSRSGTTIVAGTLRHLTPVEAARFSFLLGIPAIAGAGLVSLLRLSENGGVEPSIWVGMVVAAISGYAAIALLLGALRRVGLVPFAVYALIVGAAAVIVF